jgi:Cu/Ag efflux protein CusF
VFLNEVAMTLLQRSARGAAAFLILSAGACSQAGQLGEILGGVLGGGGAAQVAGTIRGVDTRSQSLSVQQSNGESVALKFDNQTKVVYQNQNYSVTSLENGDQVTARVQQLQDGSYYTDSVTVTQPVAGSNTRNTSGESVQALQGTVRQIDRNAGLFTIEAGNNVILTVSMPYNPSTTDRTKFQNMRTGDYVQFYGVYLNNSRVELRRFN